MQLRIDAQSGYSRNPNVVPPRDNCAFDYLSLCDSLLNGIVHRRKVLDAGDENGS
jgi:hypothetical protein